MVQPLSGKTDLLAGGSKRLCGASRYPLDLVEAHDWLSKGSKTTVCGHQMAVGKIGTRFLYQTLRSSAFTTEYARLTGLNQTVNGLKGPIL